MCRYQSPLNGTTYSVNQRNQKDVHRYIYKTDHGFLWVETSVADPGCLSRIRNFSIPDPGSKRFPDPGSGSELKNLSILTQKIVSMLSEI
jgi:hypothetical protein